MCGVVSRTQEQFFRIFSFSQKFERESSRERDNDAQEGRRSDVVTVMGQKHARMARTLERRAAVRPIDFDNDEHRVVYYERSDDQRLRVRTHHALIDDIDWELGMENLVCVGLLNEFHAVFTIVGGDEAHNIDA